MLCSNDGHKCTKRHFFIHFWQQSTFTNQFCTTVSATHQNVVWFNDKVFSDLAQYDDIEFYNWTKEPATGEGFANGMGTELIGSRDFEDAEIIVSGGRGLGKAENFSYVRDLAAVLGGAVGASHRPAGLFGE